VAATAPARAPSAPARRVALNRHDLFAACGLVILSLGLLAPHLLGLSTFVGDSDRLNIFLNLRLLEVDAWQTLGRVPAWHDAMPLGVPTGGLHWMFLGFDPVGWLVARFPRQDVFRISGLVTATHFAVGALAAYLLLRDVVRSAFPAAVGAALYVCSAFIAHGVSQLDPIYGVMILQPLGLLLLRTVRPGRAALWLLALAAVIASLVAFTFVQEVAYTLLFFGLYACFRSVIRRDWRPLAILAAAGLIGLLVASPRLGTVLGDLREVSRTSAIQATCPCEMLRWVSDGIFGRFPQEALAVGNKINLHEGMQVYTSTFAAGAIIALLLRPRRGPTFLIGMTVLVMLALLGATLGGPLRAAGISLAAALMLWIVARPVMLPRLGGGGDTLSRDPDLAFFLMTVLLAFAIVLSPGMLYLVYLAFFRVDFTHARIAELVLLPLCTLAAVAVRELVDGATRAGAAGERFDGRPHLIVGGVGAVIAIAAVLLLDPISSPVTTLLFGATEWVAPTQSYAIPTREIGRIVTAALMLAAAFALHGLALHTRSTGRSATLRLVPALRRMPALRLVPAYTIAGLMVAQAFGSSYFQFNGAHTQTFPVPFVATGNFTAPVDAFVPPTPAARQELQARLQADAFRSILVSGPDGFPMYDAPSEQGYASFVGTFWQLRLINGYPVLNRRVAELPWPDASRSLRSVSFTDARLVPWPLLAILNVKYAVVASPALLYNLATGPGGSVAEASSADLTIVENPLPVVPRAFFATSVVPRPPAPPIANAVTPAPPTAIRATTQTDQTVLLTWTGEVKDAHYEVYRRRLAPEPETAGALIATTGRGSEALMDPGLESGATYAYVVRACSLGGCGERSAPVEARVAVKSVAAPRLLAVESRSPTEAIVTWEPADDHATIQIEISTDRGAVLGEPIELPAGARSYVVQGLRPLRTYGVRLRACMDVGCSPHSIEWPVSMPSALTSAELGGGVPADPQRQSVVEGLDAPMTFGPADGGIRAEYDGDRIRIEIDPSDAQRFLVLNEIPHPDWHAYASGPAGRSELPILPTNVVMRGVLLPPGVSQIEMRFEPFYLGWLARGLVVTGLLLAVVGWWVLRRLDERSEAPRAWRHEAEPALPGLPG
jgi:hypothetical protein